MSRYASGSTSNVTVAVCSNIINKRNDNTAGITDNQVLAKNLAKRLFPRSSSSSSTGGAADPEGSFFLENILMAATEGGDDAVLDVEEVQSFLTEQRQRVKKVAEMNVQNLRAVDDFIDSIQTLKQQCLDQSDRQNPMLEEEEKKEEEGGNDDNDNNNDQLVFVDYEPKIAQLMQQHAASKAAQRLDMNQEDYVREIAQEMGEELAAAAKRGRGNDDDDDDDDEIEVVRNQGAEKVNTKCPISGTLMEAPVRNTVCGHCYSDAGIRQHMAQCAARGSHAPCPVVGCSNRAVKATQLEKSLEAEYAVKRARRQKEREQQERFSQADHLADDDDDEEEEMA